jgi:serine phosphatase RsbU (regulator of sigma subunit)
LIYSSAGHPPAVIRRRDGAIEILDASQPPLGVVKSQSFYEMNTILNVGDKILLYTDGILEARKGGDIFGLDGINEVLRLYGDKSIHYIVERMIDEAQKWDGGRLRDDAALVVIERV